MLKELKVEQVLEIPRNPEEGVLYISKEYGISVHLCACGCKQKTVLPFGDRPIEWKYTEHSDGTVSFRPSIGNFSGERPYHAHYFITRNKIDWK